MKSIRSRLILIALVSVSAAASALADSGPVTAPSGPQFISNDVGLRSGPYVTTDAGVNLAEKLKGRGDLTGLSASFSPGVRWDLSTGYAFKLADALTLAAELQVGIIYNSFDRASYNAPGFSISAPIDGNFLQVPLLFNAIVNYEVLHNWVIYAGGGVGVNFVFDNISGSDVIGDESDFAWQGFGGIKYEFGRSDLGVGYKYLGFQPSGAKTLGNNDILVSYGFHF